MKQIRVELSSVVHEFVHGLRTIWRENNEECIIFIFLIILYSVLMVFCSSQLGVKKALWMGFLPPIFVLQVSVMLNQKRTAMFTYGCMLWLTVAVYLAKASA